MKHQLTLMPSTKIDKKTHLRVFHLTKSARLHPETGEQSLRNTSWKLTMRMWRRESKY